MRNAGHPQGSWYAQTAQGGRSYPPLDGCIEVETCILGAGFTGLGAALALAERGRQAVVLEAAQVGSGGSGRNGGQIHIGHRRDQSWLEQALGRDAALDLWRQAILARDHLLSLIGRLGIDCELKAGLIHAEHRPGGGEALRRHIAHMAADYGYDSLEFLPRDRLAELLGTYTYFEGMLDTRGGHLHPLKLAQGMARSASAAGVRLCEQSRVTAWGRRPGGGYLVETAQGSVLCERLILSGDGYGEAMGPEVQAAVMPIANYILVTEPLGDLADEILVSDQAVADSRFVVSYFRKTPDGRLLFGGGETYSAREPRDVAGLVARRMRLVYPRLAHAKVTHAWGGALGVTLNRMPFLREPSPGLFVATGYSGQGVVLAPWCGRAMALASLGEREDFEVMAQIPHRPFPGGALMRWPALVAGMTYFALRDRLPWR